MLRFPPFPGGPLGSRSGSKGKRRKQAPPSPPGDSALPSPRSLPRPCPGSWRPMARYLLDTHQLERLTATGRQGPTAPIHPWFGASWVHPVVFETPASERGTRAREGSARRSTTLRRPSGPVCGPSTTTLGVTTQRRVPSPPPGPDRRRRPRAGVGRLVLLDQASGEELVQHPFPFSRVSRHVRAAPAVQEVPATGHRG